jgi:RNA polymerase sigma-70 factor, ECF subfamily
LALAEDAVQDAIARALERWDTDGVPKDAQAWIIRVAHNRMVDTLKGVARTVPLERDWPVSPITPSLDDELSLMFLCCHPSLTRSAQIALTLKVASGFTTEQIARAFLTEETTVAQRIVRAKQTLRKEEARLEMPEVETLPARLDSIVEVLYLVFTEGYSPSDGDVAVKEDLCAEALRLVRLLTGIPHCGLPKVEALQALFCFQASRSAARIADDGSSLLLQEQDRTRWDAELIGEGLGCLHRSACGGELSRFHLEAGIAACHAVARRYDLTDWPRIVSLYNDLMRLEPSPIVQVNRAVAVAMASGALAGLDELDAIPERELIARYPYALAAYAELHTSLGNLEEARGYLIRALEWQHSTGQRKLLSRKLAVLARVE